MDAKRLFGRSSSKLVCVLLLIFSCALFAAAARAAENSQPVAPKSIVGELQSLGSITYRTGVSPWLSQAAGSYPVVMPLSVKGGVLNCKVVLGSLGLFEASPSTAFKLTQEKPDLLALSIESGAVLYALPSGMRLKITVSPGNHVANAGRADSEKPARGATRSSDAETTESVFTPVANMGVAMLDANGTVQWSNLKGSLTVMRSGEQNAQSVAVGEFLRLSPASANGRFDLPFVGQIESVGPKPAGASDSSARPLGSWWILEPGESGFLFTRLAIPSNPRLQALPEPRDRMSSWLPPPRPRGIPSEPPPATPWQPPAIGR